MKFAYLEVQSIDEPPGQVPGKAIATRICQSLNGEGPSPRGDYGWEWIYRGNTYKALAVLQRYGKGWLIPVNASFLDRLLKRDASMLGDLLEGIHRALKNEVVKLRQFESEQELRESGA